MKTLFKGIIIGVILVAAEIIITNEFTQVKMWTKIEDRVTQLEQVQAVMVQTEMKMNKVISSMQKQEA